MLRPLFFVLLFWASSLPCHGQHWRWGAQATGSLPLGQMATYGAWGGGIGLSVHRHLAPRWALGLRTGALAYDQTSRTTTLNSSSQKTQSGWWLHLPLLADARFKLVPVSFLDLYLHLALGATYVQTWTEQRLQVNNQEVPEAQVTPSVAAVRPQGVAGIGAVWWFAEKWGLDVNLNLALALMGNDTERPIDARLDPNWLGMPAMSLNLAVGVLFWPGARKAAEAP